MVETATDPQDAGTRGRAAAFFDLDKTIIAKSSVIAFGGQFYREGLISKRTILRGMYAQIVYLLVGADEAKMERMREAMLTFTSGWERDHIRAIVRDTLEAVLSPIIYAEALELIEQHRASGRLTVIISSSPIEVVEPLADFLGVEHAIATRAEVDDAGRYTGGLEFYAYGAHKADAIRELAARDHLDLGASWAYSDSITDLPMLEAVGHPVVVNPDRELARIAVERGWDIRSFARPVRLRDRMPVSNRPAIAFSTAGVAAGLGAAGYVWWRHRTNRGTPASGLRGRAEWPAAWRASGDALRHAGEAVADARRALSAALGARFES